MYPKSLTLMLLIALVAAIPMASLAAENSTLYYIHSIGDGTLVVNSCLTPGRFAVKTDQKTAVVRWMARRATSVT